MVGKDGGATRACIGTGELLDQVVAIKDVVPQDQGAVVMANEAFTNQIRLGEPIGGGLNGVLQLHAPLRAVSQEFLKPRGVARCRDDEHLANAAQHQGAQRVIDHGFVVDGEQLLGDCSGGGVEPGARASRQNHAFSVHVTGLFSHY